MKKTALLMLMISFCSADAMQREYDRDTSSEGDSAYITKTTMNPKNFSECITVKLYKKGDEQVQDQLYEDYIAITEDGEALEYTSRVLAENTVTLCKTLGAGRFEHYIFKIMEQDKVKKEFKKKKEEILERINNVTGKSRETISKTIKVLEKVK